MPVERDEVGPKIDYPGLTYAPINEQGVVFLFATMCDDLLFSMEAIRPQFPDAVVIDYRGNRDRGVRKYVEFEYRSSNFSRQKSHDSAKCNIIVCWVHDWKNCPAEVEVIELRSVVQKEKGEQAKQELQKDEPIAIKKESTPRVLPDYMKFWDRRMLWVEPATRDLAQHLINRLQIEIPRLIGRPRFRWYSLYRSPPPIRKTECATVLIGRKNVKLSFRVNPRKFSDPDKISKPMAGWFYPKGTERRMTVTAENFEPACRLVKSAVQELD